MPVTPTYPGVYIQEAPSTTHVISGVPTSNTAFVDVFERGPANVPVKVTNFGEFTSTFGALNRQSRASYGIYQFFQNGGAVAWVVRIVGKDDKKKPAEAANASLKGFVDLQANGPGTWGNYLDAGAQANKNEPKNYFDLLIREVSAPSATSKTQMVVAQEFYQGLSTDENDPMYVVDVLKHQSSLAAATVPKAYSGATYPSDPTKSITTPKNQIDAASSLFTPFKGGTDGWVIDGASALGVEGNPGGEPPTTSTGLYTLNTIAPDVFNILCLPAMASFAQGEWVTAFDNAKGYCEKMMAFLIADPPVQEVSSTTEEAQVKEIQDWWEGGISNQTDHGAVYFPRIVIPDPNSAKGLPFQTETSGSMAGVYASTDASRGVWKAPAGQSATLTGVLHTAVKLDDEASGNLNPLGVNCLRTFPLVGTVSWGARTIDGADLLSSQWKYVPVRRMALFIEGSLLQGTQWAVFEPNAEPLWAAIRLSVGSFMNQLYKQGAFAGATAKDSYFVACDSTTTTALDIDQGRVNVSVGFAPLKPAEFVVITISQITSQ